MCAKYSVFFLIIFWTQNVQSLSRVDPLVYTEVGLIRGVQATDGNYSMFLGIPYAKVNKSNPFGDSTPYGQFENVFEAYDDSAICPQVYQFNGTILGTLDCLHLNVHVPFSSTFKNALPVMVWIHGGSFRRGFAGKYVYNPSNLVKHDVIVVTINYRVGVYGFMCLDIPEVSGNQGLKDQLIALQWIRNNIGAFGGDKDKITLFGESAGGHSIDLHLISLKDKLYNKVLLQSGSALATTVLHDPDKLAPLKISKYLGFETRDFNEALSFLAKIDSNMVVAAALELDMLFKPCVENEFNSINPFITKPWINGKIPKIKDMPVLLGFNKNEMAVYHVNEEPDHFTHMNIVTVLLNQTFNFDDEKLIEMKSFVETFYFGDEKITENLKWEIANFDSDYTYIHPIQRTIRKYIESEAKNIFYYMFSYSGKRNVFLNASGSDGFAAHADDLGYLFDFGFVSETPTQEDQLIIDRMTTMWTNFAKYGDPTPETSELLPVKWKSLTKDFYYYLDIDIELRLAKRPHNRRMAFWDMFYKLNEKSQRGYEEN